MLWFTCVFEEIKFWSTQNWSKWKTLWCESLKLSHNWNFSEVAHQCQFDVVPVARLLCSAPAILWWIINSAPSGPQAGPWRPYVKPAIVPAALHVSWQFLCCGYPGYSQNIKRRFSLKLTLGICILSSCQNVFLLRSRTLSSRCLTVHSTHQRQVHQAMAFLECTPEELPWRWPYADRRRHELSLWGSDRDWTCLRVSPICLRVLSAYYLEPEVAGNIWHHWRFYIIFYNVI